MPRTTKKTTETTETKEKKTEAIVYDVVNAVRVYSLEAHGKDFHTLAEQFATKKGFILK